MKTEDLRVQTIFEEDQKENLENQESDNDKEEDADEVNDLDQVTNMVTESDLDQLTSVSKQYS